MVNYTRTGYLQTQSFIQKATGWWLTWYNEVGRTCTKYGDVCIVFCLFIRSTHHGVQYLCLMVHLWYPDPTKEVGTGCRGGVQQARRWFRKGNSLKKWQLLVSMLDFWCVVTVFFSFSKPWFLESATHAIASHGSIGIEEDINLDQRNSETNFCTHRIHVWYINICVYTYI